MNYLWIPAFLMLGAVAAQHQGLLWEIEHFLTVKDGEPTELYLRFARICGILAIVCSIGMLGYLVCK